MNNSQKQNSEETILESTFKYMVKNGLEQTKIRDLCRSTGIAQGSIYYWFDDKDELICRSVEFGLRKISDKLFAFAYRNLKNYNKIFDGCISEVIKYKEDLRFIYATVSHPFYGTMICRNDVDFSYIYDVYAKNIAKKLQVSYDLVKHLVYVYVSIITDFCIWGDEEKTNTELALLRSIVLSNEALINSLQA